MSTSGSGRLTTASSVTQLTHPAPWASDRPIPIGVSSCLLGEAVRYDGGHKRNEFLSDVFGRFVTWVPVCPEVEVGLPTPRDSLRLESLGDDVRMVFPRTGADLTDEMRAFSQARIARLQQADLCGYVFKKGSPSCGLYRVRIYNSSGMPKPDGRGLFAQAVTSAWPFLPVEEEGRLSDPVLRENFVERVFAFRRLKDLFTTEWTPDDLVRFHTAHKLQLLSHSPQIHREMGRLVARAGSSDQTELETEYRVSFMSALEARATRPKHTNVLEHALGHFKKVLSPSARSLLVEAIADYRGQLIPLIVPITLLNHHVRLLEVEYLSDQTYLEPHPKELMLRNHV